MGECGEAAESRGRDPEGYRAEFVRLVDLAAALDRQHQGWHPQQ